MHWSKIDIAILFSLTLAAVICMAWAYECQLAEAARMAV